MYKILSQLEVIVFADFHANSNIYHVGYDQEFLKNSLRLGVVHTPLMPALGRQKQVDLCEFQASQDYFHSNHIEFRGCNINAN